MSHHCEVGDVVITCGRARDVYEPVIIVEVLWNSTSAEDAGRGFRWCRTLLPDGRTTTRAV